MAQILTTGQGQNVELNEEEGKGNGKTINLKNAGVDYERG